ncbi:MAG: hypothetical protein ABI425_03285 [Patescibacteria group bacterium]
MPRSNETTYHRPRVELSVETQNELLTRSMAAVLQNENIQPGVSLTDLSTHEQNRLTLLANRLYVELRREWIQAHVSQKIEEKPLTA